MILETYLKQHNINFRQFNSASGIPESTIRSLNKRDIDKWNIEYFNAVAKVVGKNKFVVMKELEDLEAILKTSLTINLSNLCGRYNLENRRYIGNKNKLMNWISGLLDKHTSGETFFDVFAGTGVVSKGILSKYSKLILNDFLYSNNVIFKAFFGTQEYNTKKLLNYQRIFQKIHTNSVDNDYFVDNYGGKFFSEHDAKVIGEIRTRIEQANDLNERERTILLASLIYSSDKIANTVGHYDAYRKKEKIKDSFIFELITPLNISGKEIEIYREDANELVRKVSADIAFIDPPYNSRQYSRFYHVLESIVKWDKPELEGVAMKPPVENMSEYSKTRAPEVFDDLIKNLNVKYIVVTYNNTYKSKSSSSKNKITHEQIQQSLNNVGDTQCFEMPFQFFNAGKTDLKDHKEFVFITEVRKFIAEVNNVKSLKKKQKSIRSPLFYVGDKYKLMPQLKELFPSEINTYYDVFCGGGSASINVNAKKFVMNDVNKKIIQLHQHLQIASNNINSFIEKMYSLIEHYGLSLSEKGKNEKIEALKKIHKKTYFSKYNKEAYLKLRDDYNKDQTNFDLLYLLLIYGFNHMIRFNGQEQFNLPVGNVDWNKNVTTALKNYSSWYNANKITMSSGMDFEKFVESVKLKSNDFLYFDPPYLITFSDYNKLWNEEEERRLYRLLVRLDKKGIKWGVSNLVSHKGKQNHILLEWAQDFRKYRIESNYISKFDNTVKKDSKEIYVTNY